MAKAGSGEGSGAAACVVDAEGLFIPRKVRYWLLMALKGLGRTKTSVFYDFGVFILDKRYCYGIISNDNSDNLGSLGERYPNCSVCCK